MERAHFTLSRQDLDDALERLSRAPSLTTTERACVAYSGGRAPEVEGRLGFGRCWVGSAIPWWLLPLRWIVTGDRCLIELIEADRLVSFANEADACFDLEFHSFRRDLMPSVFEHLRRGGITSEPAEIIDRDPSFFELRISCDAGRHESWLLRARWGRECPEDLAEVVQSLDD